MSPGKNLDSIDNILIEEFHQGLGEAYINTLDGGGGYAFLLDKALERPILIINFLNYKNGLNLKFIINNKEYNLYSNNLKETIKIFKLNKIYINHIIWANNFLSVFDEIIESCSSIELNVYIHDFFTVCPTINLLNYNGQYCNVPSNMKCRACISKYRSSINAPKFSKKQMVLYRPYLKGDIGNWRNLWKKIFDHSKYIIVPSKSTADIFNKAYENYYVNKVFVREHSLKSKYDIKPKLNNKKNSFLNIYLLGLFNEHKGSNILKSLIQMTAKERLNICYHVLGQFEYNKYIKPQFLKLHGPYKQDELANLLNTSDIDMFIQPSICPETFSYVIHEMKMTNLPIMAFNLGAQAEFLANYENGILINEITAEAMFNKIKSIYNQHMKEIDPILQAKNVKTYGLVRIKEELFNTLSRMSWNIKQLFRLMRVILRKLRNKMSTFF